MRCDVREAIAVLERTPATFRALLGGLGRLSGPASTTSRPSQFVGDLTEQVPRLLILW